MLISGQMSIGIRITAPALSRQMSISAATTVYGRPRTYLTNSTTSPPSHRYWCGRFPSTAYSYRPGHGYGRRPQCPELSVYKGCRGREQAGGMRHNLADRALAIGLDALSATWIVGDIDLKVLKPLAASGKADFQLELVRAVEVPRGAIESDEGWHVDAQALFEIGRLERAALDADGAVRWRGHKPNRRQRTRGTIRPNVGVDADPHVAARRRLALKPIGLRVSDEDGEGQDPGGEPASAHRQREITCFVTHRSVSSCTTYYRHALLAKTSLKPIRIASALDLFETAR